MNPIHLQTAFARQIEKEGAAAFPNECCGLLFGRDFESRGIYFRMVERIAPVENAFEAGEQYHRFTISPRQLMQAEKDAAAEDRLVLGFYHSHPNAPARPSEYDREHGWPFYSYVIVSIADGNAVDMTSWILDERSETFARQDIVEF